MVKGSKKENGKTVFFKMRMTPEDREKLDFLFKRYNEKSAAEFLQKFIRNEYSFVMEELREMEKDDMFDQFGSDEEWSEFYREQVNFE